jgi:uncharacterized protein YndB with AHSA1/START domain
VDVDPQPGGTFAVDMAETQVRGSHVIVEPPPRVVFTSGIPGSENLPAGSTTVEIVLRGAGDTIVVELTHRDLPDHWHDGHQQGWIDRLGSLAASLQG